MNTFKMEQKIKDNEIKLQYNNVKDNVHIMYPFISPIMSFKHFFIYYYTSHAQIEKQISWIYNSIARMNGLLRILYSSYKTNSLVLRKNLPSANPPEHIKKNSHS